MNKLECSFLSSPDEFIKTSSSQIGTSSCGQTSIRNILLSLGIPEIPKNELLLQLVPPRLRNYQTESLSEYLLSRVRAGTIHDEIIKGVELVTKGEVFGRFFLVNAHENIENLRNWLLNAFEHKLAVVFTENLFILGNDAWHHQMAYGIEYFEDDAWIFLTNPVQKVSLRKILAWISAGSWMIIPKEHVLERKITFEDVKELQKVRWETFDVLPRILEIYQESSLKDRKGYGELTIPWGGLGGISVFCQKENKGGMEWLEKFAKKKENIFLPFYERFTEAIKLSL